MTKFSFIIPSYNSYKTISYTLSSIFHQRAAEHVKEVIVVDASTDENTRNLLRGFNDLKLKLVLINRKSTPALLRNIGAEHASGDVLCFIDSDVFLDEGWLDNVLQAYAQGCCSGAGSVAAPYFQNSNVLALAQLYLQFNESLEVGKTRRVSMVPACNMYVDRALFNQVGGFPGIRAAEDVLLCLKMGEISGVYFIPAARCFHIFRERFQSYFNNQEVLGKYIIIYRRMTQNRWYYRGLWPVIMLPGFLLIKLFRIESRISQSGWEHLKKAFLSFPLFLAGLFFWAIGFLEGCFSKEELYDYRTNQCVQYPSP
jgi:glycosyltransferase involved in cell wall biosynthesis